MKDLLEAIYEDQEDVYYCCYCLRPQAGKIGCCQDIHFVEFKYLDNDCKQEIAQKILNG